MNANIYKLNTAQGMAGNMKYKDGVHSISNDEYHAGDGISRSQLVLFDKSPYHFWYNVLSGQAVRRETPSTIIGNAFHTLLLEPDLFNKEYAVLPEINKRTKVGKEEYQNFCDKNQDKILMSIDQYEKVAEMISFVRQHDIVNSLISDAQYEQSIFWTDADTGLQFKSRMDVWSGGLIVDIKTTADASPHKMSRAALDYGYYLQAGMMHEGCKALGKPFDEFVILACEKEAPYSPAVYRLDEETVQFGIDQFQSYKHKLKQCIDSNEWPAYEMRELTVPQYTKKKAAEL